MKYWEPVNNNNPLVVRSSDLPAPYTPPINLGARTRFLIWWDGLAVRRRAVIALIGYTVILFATNGFTFWAIGGDAGTNSNTDAALTCLHMYLWCVALVGWSLFMWTKYRPLAKGTIVLWMVFGPVALFIVLALLVIAASGTGGNSNTDYRRRY